jgi:hypothetical protein
MASLQRNENMLDWGQEGETEVYLLEKVHT